MNTISFAGTGTYILTLEVIAYMFGLELPEGSVAGAVNAIVVVGAFVLLVWGQLRRKDLHLGLFRK